MSGTDNKNDPISEHRDVKREWNDEYKLLPQT